MVTSNGGGIGSSAAFKLAQVVLIWSQGLARECQTVSQFRILKTCRDAATVAPVGAAQSADILSRIVTIPLLGNRFKLNGTRT